MANKLSVIYRVDEGADPYSDYVDSLRGSEGATKIRIRVTRAGLYKVVSKMGNPELKIFIGILTAASLQMHFRAIHQLGCR